MLLNLIRYGFDKDVLIQVLISVPIIIFSLSFHEFSHAFAAYKLGDPTAKNLGRLTLNPLKHLDPVGAVMMLLVGFGYARPVPINSRLFKKPKWGMALSALAGPLSNLLIAFVASFFIQAAINAYNQSAGNQLLYILILFLMMASRLNISLAIFNLLPVPPLDGSRILFVFLPSKYYFAIMRYEQYIRIGLLLLIFSGGLSGFLSNAVDWLYGIFSSLSVAVFG